MKLMLLFLVLLLAFFSPCCYGQLIEKSEIENLKAHLATNPKDAQSYYKLGMLLDQQQQKEEALANLEMAIKLEPQNLKNGNDYRLRCIAYKEYDRSVNFFENLIKEKDVLELHMQLALAYVDKMPSTGLEGIIGKAILSTKSIQELNKILEKDPNSWTALYARGMNYLHWPKSLDRAPDAIRDFKKLLEIQGLQGKTSKPCFVTTYIALGDAYVKNGQIKEAREAWKKGLELFPRNSQLKERLSLGEDKELVEFVDKERGLDIQVDTDLSVLWR